MVGRAEHRLKDHPTAHDGSLRVFGSLWVPLDPLGDDPAAEYVAARASDLAPKPKSLSFEYSAAIPLSGLTAWQSLFDYAKLSKGRETPSSYMGLADSMVLVTEHGAGAEW